MLALTIAAFARHEGIRDIQVVIHPADTGLYAAVAAPFESRLRPPVFGGARRQELGAAGLEALAAEAPERVLIHDAARPFIGGDLIDRVLGAPR